MALLVLVGAVPAAGQPPDCTWEPGADAPPQWPAPREPPLVVTQRDGGIASAWAVSPSAYAQGSPLYEWRVTVADGPTYIGGSNDASEALDEACRRLIQGVADHRAAQRRARERAERYADEVAVWRALLEAAGLRD